MLRRLAVALLLISAAGCDSPTEPPAGVMVSVELSQEVAAPGDVVEAEITLRNDSNNTITLASGCGFALLEVRRVLDQQIVSHGDPYYCIMVARNLVVEPGSELTTSVRLTISSSSAITPGSYVARGLVQIHGHGTVRSAPQALQVVD